MIQAILISAYIRPYERVDAYIPTPERQTDLPFLMSIEDVLQLPVVEQLLLVELREVH